jgi:hypothetical protein
MDVTPGYILSGEALDFTQEGICYEHNPSTGRRCDWGDF